MSFTESYKQLEKLCGEIMNDDRRVSAYIDEMINTPRGSYLVKGWDSDLKQLKHYRWIRNQIAHTPDCTHPRTLYAKATAPNTTEKAAPTPKTKAETYPCSQQATKSKKTSKKAIGFVIFAAMIALAVAVIFIISKSF